MADKKPEKKETSTEAVKKVDKKLPFFKRIGKWFRDMKSELKKVVWPTPKQTANNTAVCAGGHVRLRTWFCGASTRWPIRACSFC